VGERPRGTSLVQHLDADSSRAIDGLRQEIDANCGAGA